MNLIRAGLALPTVGTFAVIGLAILVLAEAPAPGTDKAYTKIGQIDHPAIAESSGVIASRKYPGVFWTHSDSGNPAEIYAISKEGKFIAQFAVAAKNRDWEDIAIDDDGHLFIGDVGNNGGHRKEVHVYQLDEPDPTAKYENGKGPTLRVKKTWKLRYPDAPFDCESLFIWKGNAYLVSKLFTGLAAEIYRFPLNDKNEVLLERVTSIPIHSPVTSASVSADGSQMAVLTYIGLNVFQIDGDVAKAHNVKPKYTRLIHAGIEGCCFTPDGVLVTAESREIYFFPGPK